MVLLPHLPENSLIEYTFGSFDHSESPQITSIYAGFRGFAGTTLYVGNTGKFNGSGWSRITDVATRVEPISGRIRVFKRVRYAITERLGA